MKRECYPHTLRVVKRFLGFCSLGPSLTTAKDSATGYPAQMVG
jgi:hypothetical protein